MSVVELGYGSNSLRVLSLWETLTRNRSGRRACPFPACLCLKKEKVFEDGTRSRDLAKVTSRPCNENKRAQVRNTTQLDIKGFGKRRPLLRKGK